MKFLSSGKKQSTDVATPAAAAPESTHIPTYCNLERNLAYSVSDDQNYLEYHSYYYIN